jgi:hypothetical protein
MRPVPPSQAYFSAALTAAAVAFVSPSVPWPSSPPAAALDAAIVSPARTAGQPALSEGRAFASYRARARPAVPAPSTSASVPRVSDDLDAARVIPSPAPKPSRAPVQAPAAAPQPSRTAPAAPYPSYTPVPAQSAAYGSPQAYAESLVGAAQFSCLEPLWQRESGWNTYAQNPSSGAYGIPQALPGDKMASAGPDWQTDGDTQVRWGVSYIDSVYGSPCGALAHENADGWY